MVDSFTYQVFSYIVKTEYFLWCCYYLRFSSFLAQCFTVNFMAKEYFWDMSAVLTKVALTNSALLTPPGNCGYQSKGDLTVNNSLLANDLTTLEVIATYSLTDICHCSQCLFFLSFFPSHCTVLCETNLCSTDNQHAVRYNYALLFCYILLKS